MEAHNRNEKGWVLYLKQEYSSTELARDYSVEDLKSLAVAGWIEIQKGEHEACLKQLARIGNTSWPEWPKKLREEVERSYTEKLEKLRREMPVKFIPLEWEEEEEGQPVRSMQLFLDGSRDDESQFIIIYEG